MPEDQPAAVAATQQGASPGTVPQADVKPSGAATSPAQQPTPGAQPGTSLDPSNELEWVDPQTGQRVVSTIGDLINAHSKSVPNEDLELGTLARRALKDNDPEAIRTLIDRFSPVGPPSPPKPDTEIDVLRKEVNELKTRLAEAGSTVDMVNQAVLSKRTHEFIEANKESFPMTAAHPLRSNLVQAAVGNIRNVLEQRGVNTRNLPPEMRGKVYTAAMEEVEKFLKVTADSLGVAKAPPKPGGPVISAVNDQQRSPRPNEGQQYMLINGQLVPVTQPSAPGAPIPPAPVTPVTGTPPGVAPDANRANQQFDRNSFREMLRARAAAMNPVVNQ